MEEKSQIEDEEEQQRVEMLKNSVLTLQSCLQRIVENQKNVLQDDEEYQKKFYKLCNDIGVDPFTQKKGFLAGLLNKNLDEFYKSLGMRVLGICINTRYENGGLIRLTEVKERLNRNKNAEHVHRDDIRTAVRKISCLSNSLSIETIEDQDGVVEYIKSSDMNFTVDSLKVLSKANRQNGKICKSDLGSDDYGRWVKELDSFVDQGIAWVDDYQGILTYYFPSIIFGSSLRVFLQTIHNPQSTIHFYFLAFDLEVFAALAALACCIMSSIQSMAASSRSLFSVVILNRFI